MTFKKFFTSRLAAKILLAGGALALHAASASAYSLSLESIAAAGPCGGSVGCFTTVDQIKNNASQGDVVSANNLQTLPGASAHAFASTTFGLQRAYADAYNAQNPGPYPGYAETTATSIVRDAILGSSVASGAYTFHFNLTGFLTPTSGAGAGYSDFGYLYVTAYDAVTGINLGGTSTVFTDTSPSGVVNIPTVLTAGHGINLTVELSASAYSSSYGYATITGPTLIVADYSDTLTYYVTSADATAPHLLGASGHDYSVNPALAVPEPSTWALMIAGFLGLGFLSRRQKKAPAAMAPGA